MAVQAECVILDSMRGKHWHKRHTPAAVGGAARPSPERNSPLGASSSTSEPASLPYAYPSDTDLTYPSHDFLSDNVFTDHGLPWAMDATSAGQRQPEELGIMGRPSLLDSSQPRQASATATAGGSGYFNPVRLLAEAGETPNGGENASMRDTGERELEGSDDVGIASRTYFDQKPSPTTTYSAFLQSAEIMKLITVEE